MRTHMWKSVAAAAAVATALAVSCTEEDPEDSSLTPPTAAQLTDTWQVVRQTSNLSFTAMSTQADFGGPLLEITSQYIVSYTPGDTDTCFCADSMPYRLSGNAIVFDNPLVDSVLREMFGNYSMTWAQAGADLRITITGTMVGGDELPPGTRFSMIMNYSPYTGVFPPPSCAECSGIRKARTTGAQAQAAGIVGRWSLTGTTVNASGTINENTSYSSVTQILRFLTDTTGPDSVYAWTYDIDENPNCHTMAASEYALQGSSLTGELFSGTETTDSSHYTYSTTAGMSGDMLVLSSRVEMSENTSTVDMQTAGTNTLYLTRYDGAVPPADWPQSVCPSISKRLAGSSGMPSLHLPCAVPVWGVCH